MLADPRTSSLSSSSGSAMLVNPSDGIGIIDTTAEESKEESKVERVPVPVVANGQCPFSCFFAIVVVSFVI